MITKIQGEAPFQVLTNNFSISPSQEGYTLQISADGVNYSNLFSVGANVTRLVTGVAANSYYRLLGNNSEVSINWMKTCVTEGGGGDMSNYYTKQETDAAISSSTSPIQEQLDDVERVTASALTELHNDVLEISGATPDMSDYVRINGPVLPLEWGIQGNEYPEKVFNAFFTGAPYLYLASVTNVDMYSIIPNLDGIDWTNEFTIDAENKELYVENVPAGLYRILLENIGNDTGSTFFVMPGNTDDETKGIYTHTTEIPGALKPFETADPDAIIVSDSVDASLAYWTVDKDAERMTIKFEEDPDNPGEYTYHYFLTYKPTIDEVAADVDEAFSAITETQQVASAGLNSLDDKISILSGNTYTKAQVDAEIASAKTYVDNRIDGYNTASTITITSTPMTEGYWLDFSEDTLSQNGPEFQMFKTSKSNLVVADISSLNNGSSEYTQPDWGVYLMGFDSADQAYDIQMIVDLPSSVSLTPQNYNMDIPFIVGTSPVNRVALEWNNLSSVGYPNYFIYNTDTMVGHFAYDLNINEFVPGVVKSDGEITKVKKLTQAEYDAITTPDASTLYIIVNN